MIKAVIFDCFGVLYPQAVGQFFERYKDLLGDDSTALDQLNLQIDLGKITRAEFFAGLAEKIGMPADKIQSEIDRELVADQQLVEFIKKMKKTYKTGMLSNAGKEEIAIVYRDRLDGLFDSITVSYEAGIVKPSSEIYLICAQRLGVDPTECLFIDDSVINIDAAQKLGMKTILYATYGMLPEELTTLINRK